MNRVNIVNIVLRSDSICTLYIGLCLDNRFKVFPGFEAGKDAFHAERGLIEYLKNFCQTYPKRKQIMIFSTNLTLFFLKFVQVQHEGFSYKYFIQNGNVYSFTLTHIPTDCVIILKCIQRLTGIEPTEYLPHLLSYKSTLDSEWVTPDKTLKLTEEVNKKDLKLLITVLSTIGLKLESLHPRWSKYSSSVSSIAFNIFNRHYNLHNLNLTVSLTEDSLFRKAYYGGRCEVFGNPLYDEKIFHFDFKNMYGTIMLGNFPLKKYTYVSRPLNVDKPGFYCIKGFSAKNYIPVLPHNASIEEKQLLIFSNGEISGMFWYEEILLFQEYGGVVKEITEGYIFEDKFYPLFKEFADSCIQKRKEDKLSNTFWKNVLTAFYGRLGMRSYNTKTTLVKKEDYKKFLLEIGVENLKKETWFQSIGLVEYGIIPDDFVRSNVIYAAIITSRGRIKLYRALKSVQQHGGRILYCDTDSVFAAYKRTVLGERHGEIVWSLSENPSVIERATFASTRNYSYIANGEETTKIAGIPRNSISYQTFANAFYLDAVGIGINVSTQYAFAYNKWNDIAYISLNEYKGRCFNQNKIKTKPLLKVENTYEKDPFEYNI